MPLALVIPKPRVRVPATSKLVSTPPVEVPSAGARLLDYFGIGATLALTPAGAIVTQADHLIEVLRLEDLADRRSVPIGWTQTRS